MFPAGIHAARTRLALNSSGIASTLVCDRAFMRALSPCESPSLYPSPPPCAVRNSSSTVFISSGTRPTLEGCLITPSVEPLDNRCLASRRASFVSSLGKRTLARFPDLEKGSWLILDSSTPRLICSAKSSGCERVLLTILSSGILYTFSRSAPTNQPYANMWYWVVWLGVDTGLSDSNTRTIFSQSHTSNGFLNKQVSPLKAMPARCPRRSRTVIISFPFWPNSGQ
mmetsp:Transcript_11044/g.40459  ORF Transcript_11044/g.40459 Transcript_11044/m.40459 type:complete len:226 (+) Transcript_11044:1309-1986(+)